MDIRAQVYKVVSTLSGQNPDSIEDGTTIASLGIDSLNLMDLVFQVQDLCDVEFGDKDLLPSNLGTVGSIITTVERLRG